MSTPIYTYISDCHNCLLLKKSHTCIAGILQVSAFDAKLPILANNYKCSCCFTRSEKENHDVTHASRVFFFLGISMRSFIVPLD